MCEQCFGRGPSGVHSRPGKPNTKPTSWSSTNAPTTRPPLCTAVINRCAGTTSIWLPGHTARCRVSTEAISSGDSSTFITGAGIVNAGGVKSFVFFLGDLNTRACAPNNLGDNQSVQASIQKCAAYCLQGMYG